MHVKPEAFDETVRGLKALANLDGIVITVPYKPRIVPFVDRLMPTGERVGAINAMRREPDGTWVGDMFDGKGMLRGLREQGADPKGLRVMLLGAGGAGSAIADAVADAGAASLTIFDVDKAKAGELAEAHRKMASRLPGVGRRADRRRHRHPDQCDADRDGRERSAADDARQARSEIRRRRCDRQTRTDTVPASRRRRAAAALSAAAP